MRRAVAVVAVALAIVAGLPIAASAHANLLSSDPANGATMPDAPTEIRMTFSERPDAGLSAVELLDSGGATIPTGTPAPEGAATLVVGITNPLPDGVYTVSWRVVSVDDGHVTAGAFAFGVGTSAGTVTPVEGGSATSGPTPLGVVSKALLYAGLMLLVAIAVVSMWVFGGAPEARRRLGSVGGRGGPGRRGRIPGGRPALDRRRRRHVPSLRGGARPDRDRRRRRRFARLRPDRAAVPTPVARLGGRGGGGDRDRYSRTRWSRRRRPDAGRWPS